MHSLSEIDRYSLLEGQDLDAVELEDWDGWVYGVSVVGDRISLLGDNRGEEREGDVWISRFGTFDVVTGQLLENFYIDSLDGFELSGLWCGGTP